MVGSGFAMLAIGLWNLWTRWRGTPHEDRWLHRCAVLMAPSGLVAVLAGWVTTEVGRQPFTIYGLMRTADSAAPLAAPAVATSLIVFIVDYLAVFGAGTFYISRLMSHPPHSGEKDLGETMEGLIRSTGIVPGPAMGERRIVGAE